MMPLILAEAGEEAVIKRVGGSPEMKKHLEDMGFTVGGAVTVMSAIGGDLIVKIKGSRVAINKEMAQKIMI
ncbi:MAG: ferrous iron transport protein A [Oscillospiraceae bacterium]|nr:ferrous iron transport protein A [Oscillospiraceae bacterium]